MKIYRVTAISLFCTVALAAWVGTVVGDRDRRQWTRGILNAANQLFQPRSGWSFDIGHGGTELIANLEARPDQTQTVNYYDYGITGRLIGTSESTWDSSSGLTNFAAEILAYNSLSEVVAVTEIDQETGVNTDLSALRIALRRLLGAGDPPAAVVEVQPGFPTVFRMVIHDPAAIEFYDENGRRLRLCPPDD